jgi:hypothetical protein
MASLDEDRLPYQAILLHDPSPLTARIMAEFYKSPHRILIGTERVSFPVSPSHMLKNCLFWQLAMEAGDTPQHILTECKILPDDLKFHQAWCIANGLITPKISDLSHNIYLDYLLFRSSDSDTAITSKTKIVETKRKIALHSKLLEDQVTKYQQEKELQKDVLAYTQALAIIINASKALEENNPCELPENPTLKVREILKEHGLVVAMKKIGKNEKCFVKYDLKRKAEEDAQSSEITSSQKKAKTSSSSSSTI